MCIYIYVLPISIYIYTGYVYHIVIYPMMLYIIVIYPIYHCDASYSYISYISWIITINEYIYIYTYITHISIY